MTHADGRRTTRADGRRTTQLCLLALLLAIASCSRAPRQRELRLISTSYRFTIIPSEAPPRAREAILYRVVIRDRENSQPIETGEGQIYASNEERSNTWDGFAKGAEVGTYYGKLNFVTAGLWAVAIRFRRDSLHPLEKVEWMQDVLNERQAAVP
jgi:hypothetical protein